MTLWDQIIMRYNISIKRYKCQDFEIMFGLVWFGLVSSCGGNGLPFSSDIDTNSTLEVFSAD